MSINLLGIIREIEISLYSSDFREWLRALPADQNKAIGDLRSDIGSCRSGIETGQLRVLANKLEELSEPLQAGTNELIAEIDKIVSAIKTIELLGNVLGLIGKVVAVAAVPSAAPFTVAMEAAGVMKAKAAHSLSMKAEKSFAEEKAPLFLSEEVLYGVELTKEKLIITVATGGCTNEGSFRFDVNKGSGGQQPYTVTIYRIEPDECDGNFEPIPLSYSREELGIDGPVEFILRNKIGNTSQHRLGS